MTKGYNEYYLCGDKTLASLIRDDVLKGQHFEMPPVHLLDRMRTLGDVLTIDDPYNVMVITDDHGNPLTYRIETIKSFKKEHILALEQVGFDFESIIPKGESIAIYLNETGL